MGYKIGLTQAGMVTLASLGIKDPYSVYTQYSQAVQLGDGTLRGAGYPRVSWAWGVISLVHRDILRTYCPGASAEIFIETRTADTSDIFAAFQAVVIWPVKEEIGAGNPLRFREMFTLEFQRLVAL